jgi:RNA polymerase sigma-70 factor (ECF subfamily)
MEKELLAQIGKGNKKAFDELFKSYYRYLVTIAFAYVKDMEQSKDLAQEVFLGIWNREEPIEINYSVKAYLRGAIINHCKTALRRKKHSVEIDDGVHQLASKEDAQKAMELNELNQKIQHIIDAMPDRCRAVFLLSRRENLSHKEIAAKLNISTKTIENQMTKALKMLRNGLKEQHLIAFALIIIATT